MMAPTEFLAECERRGVSLRVLPGDRLHIGQDDLPKSFLPYVKANKTALVELLKKADDKVLPQTPRPTSPVILEPFPLEIKPTEGLDTSHISCSFEAPDDFGVFTDQRTGEALTASGVWWLIENDYEPDLAEDEWARFAEWIKQADARLGYSRLENPPVSGSGNSGN
jgi:hypothetical protein